MSRQRPSSSSVEARVAIQQMGHVRANALKHTTGVIYQAGPGLVEYDRTTKSRIVLFRNDSSVP